MQYIAHQHRSKAHHRKTHGFHFVDLFPTIEKGGIFIEPKRKPGDDTRRSVAQIELVSTSVSDSGLREPDPTLFFSPRVPAR